MVTLLQSLIVEGLGEKRIHLHDSSAAELDRVLWPFDFSADGFMEALHLVFRGEGWPWVVICLRREAKVLGHFALVRHVMRNLVILSYPYMRDGFQHMEEVRQVGVLMIPSRGIGRKLAQASPVIRNWWPDLHKLDKDTTHLVIGDAPDQQLIRNLPSDAEVKAMTDRTPDEKSSWKRIKPESVRDEYLACLLESAYELGQYRQILDYGLPLLRRYPDSLMARYAVALAYFHLSQWQVAFDFNRQTLIRHPRMIRILELQGCGAEALGLNRTACGYYERVIRIDPYSVCAWQGLVRLHLSSGRIAEALTCIGQLEELEEAGVQEWYSAGMALTDAGRFAEAVLAMEKALLRDPGNPTCMHNYALALCKANRPAEAMPFCAAALQTEPDNPVYLDAQALIFDQLGRHPERRRARHE